MSDDEKMFGTYIEPAFAKTQRGQVEGRWRWWYSAIADIMIRSPHLKIQDIAAELGKGANTVSTIVNTDMFKEYLHQRKEEWRREHDHMLRAKLTDVVSEGLDILLDQLKTKKGQVPIPMLVKVTEGALDRLGYAPSSGPQVVVNNNTGDNNQIVQVNGLTTKDLEDARAAMRAVEQAKKGTSLAPPASPTDPLALDEGVGPVIDVEVGE